jgi:hypothetical protein
MAYDSTIRQDVFKRMGVYIKWWYTLSDMKSTLDGLLGNAITEFELGASPSAEDKAAYEAFSIEIRRQKDDLESLRQSVVNLASSFFGTNVKALLNSPYSTPESVLDHLRDAMDDYDDQVLQNTVAADATVTEDEDNSVLAADGLSLNFGATASQMAQNDRFALTCVDDSVVDQERWTLESARLGQYSGEIVTATAVAWAAAGISGLTIPQAPIREISDSSSKVSDWKLSGAVRGTNVTSDGRLYLKFGAAPTLTVENDELGQLTSFAFSGSGKTAVFGDESDIDGKLYVSLVKEPASIDVLGGVVAQIAEAGLIIDGASDSNTTAGALYVKVIKANGTSSGSKYTINLYKEAARTTLVAHSTIDNVPEDTVPTDAFNLTADSGITGKITLSAFASVENGTDESIIIKVPRYFVRVYRSSARSSDDLVAEGVSYQPKPAGAVDLDPVGDFLTTGAVNLNYIQDNEEIVLSGVFYTIDAYRADPADTDTTDADIVARAGSVDNLLTGSTSDLPLVEVGGSGLRDASVDLAVVTVSGGYVASACVGFANGDKFTFGTSATDAGRFQTFLRDNFGNVFPSAASPGNEINEAWAGA